MSKITTHVLDTSLGKPVADVQVKLELFKNGDWRLIGQNHTDQDGRVQNLMGTHGIESGVYRLSFELKAYFSSQKRSCFFPSATLVFEVISPSEHHHVPLLVSGCGYSTYRGS